MPPTRYAPTNARHAHALGHPSHGTKAPNRRRSGGGVTDGGPLADPVPIEEFPPPPWRSVLNSRADLGFPDYYPSRPGFGQPEDELTDLFVKNGFVWKQYLSSESFSMHGPVHHQLTATGGLEKLMDFGKEIVAFRNKSMPSFQERAFRIPVRVTYNDAKRLQFLADLANPAIPLTRLMRNPVPYGFKGVDMFDHMFAPPQPAIRGVHSAAAEPRPPPEPIPVDRALWFIRVLGANEISAHRGRAQPAVSVVQAPSPVAATPSSTATAPSTTVPINSNDWYTADFTANFTAWLRIQLSQLVLPSKAKAGQPPPPKAPAGILGDEKSRTRWLAKWQYSNQLLRQLYCKRLISPRLLAGWLADFLGTANLAQLGFVTQLLHESILDLAAFPTIARHAVRSACAKIEEIRASPAKDTMTKVEELLVSITRVLYDSDPDVLLSPTTWTRHARLLATIVDSTTATFASLRRRNDALIFRPVAIDTGTSPRRQQMAEINMLDSIAAETNMTALCKTFFSGSCAPTSPKIDVAKLEEKVFILVNWAMGLYQLGIHRPYAAYTLLRKWLEWYEDQRPHQHFDFFPILYKWLDTAPAALRPENVLPIGISYGEFTRQGMFSYGRYLNTLISRGHSARYHTNGPLSHHLELLRVMPIFVEAKDLLEQRRVVLSGDGEARERDQAEEDAALDQFREELKEYVPELFGLRRYGRSAQLRESIDYQIPSTAGITRFEFVQTRFWLSAAAFKHFKRQGSQPPMSPSTFVRIMNIYRQCRGYSTMTDFLVKSLTGTEDEEILLIILDLLKRDADVWTSVDRWKQITTALITRFRTMQRKGRFFQPLAAVLLMLAAHGRVTADAENEVRAAIAAHQAKSPPVPAFTVDITQSMDGLRVLISSGDSERALALAPKMFTRHGKFTSWSTTWWQTILKAVQAGDAKPNAIEAAVAHMKEVVEQAGDGSLRPVVAAWVETLTPATRADIFGRRNVPPVVRLLVSLVVARLIGSLILLERLVFPELKHAATICTGPNPRLSSKRVYDIEWTVTLTQQLLLCTAHKSLPPANLREAFIVQTARAVVFHASNVEALIQHLPVLVVLERSKIVPEKTRTQISNIFRGLAALPQFKTAAFRNLDVLKDAFLSNDWIKRSNDSSLETGMVEGLKLMMSDSIPGVKSSPSLPSLDRSVRYSAWRWTRVVLEMRVEFKRLTMRIANNDDPVEARQALSRLVRSSLDREASTDDMDLLTEAFRGADSVVAQEILSVGLDRLGVLLSQLLSAENQHTVEDTSLAVDLVLRVIGSTGRQERLDPTTAAARDRLLNLLSVAFQSLERQVTADDDVQLLPGASPAEPGDVLKVALKLVRFVLSVPTTEVHMPTTPKPDYAQLVVAFLHLVVALSGRSHIESDLDSMRDLLIFLVDSIPPSAQSNVYNALAYELSTSCVQELLVQHPSFASALPRPVSTLRPMALTGSQAVDGEGIALDDRPWEMIEQMVTLPIPKHGDLFLASKPLKDTASIPIALFKPQILRDAVPEVTDGEQPWEKTAAERNLGNGFAGEPVIARQTATLLFTRETSLDETTENLPIAPATRTKRNVKASTPSSTLSKGAGTTAEPIVIDSESDSSGEDDDVQEAEPEPPRPAAKRPRTGSKTSTVTGSRHVTGGKAPRKTSSAATGTARKTRPCSEHDQCKAPAELGDAIWKHGTVWAGMSGGE